MVAASLSSLLPVANEALRASRGHGRRPLNSRGWDERSCQLLGRRSGRMPPSVAPLCERPLVYNAVEAVTWYMVQQLQRWLLTSRSAGCSSVHYWPRGFVISLRLRAVESRPYRRDRIRRRLQTPLGAFWSLGEESYPSELPLDGGDPTGDPGVLTASIAEADAAAVTVGHQDRRALKALTIATCLPNESL